MTYTLFVYDDPTAIARLPDEEQQTMYREYESLAAIAGLSGYRLRPPDSATTVRIQDGARELTPGRFAEDGYLFSGFYIFRTDEHADALEIAARIPAARLGGAVELRPVANES